MKMKWWLTGAGLFLALLATGIAVTYLLLDDEGEANGEDQAESEPADLKPAIYKSVEPPVIVNFQEPERGARFLQVGIEVMTRDERIIDVIEHNMPAIRNDLILLLSDQEPEVLRSSAGKEDLRGQVRSTIQKVVSREAPQLEDKNDKSAGKTGDPVQNRTAGVEAVYFTKFVMQ